jgi:hypothetical protein
MSDNDRRRRLDSVIPEIIKRAVEIGVEKAVEAPDSLKEFVGGMKLPRDAANYLLSQVEETKNGLFRVVGKEVREFLEQTNLGAEMQKMLTTLQFEISTTIRFKPNESATGDGADAKLGKPEVKADVQVRRVRPPAPQNATQSQRADLPRVEGPAPSDERPRDRRRSRE